ncbi:MAG: hypothetical protein HOP09_00470 [Hyphomicrobium sp.]|nr:hypothetical protein [Hyphomicrobium sp.]
MNAILDKAIAAMSRLPDAVQEAIAREVLNLIDADARWDTFLGDPRSRNALSQLAAQARDEIARVDVPKF